jgi:hypothetical protein
MAAPVKQTLGSYSGLDGQPIETIEDQLVTVTGIRIEKRRFKDDPQAPYAVITLADGQVLHTWSAFLIEQLAAIPDDALPGETVFRKVTTKNNREVWKMD